MMKRGRHNRSTLPGSALAGLILACLIAIPAVATAEPVAPEAEELQLMPDLLDTAHDDLMAGREVGQAAGHPTTLRHLDGSGVNDLFVLWNSADPLLLELATHSGMPLFADLHTGHTVGNLVFSHHHEQDEESDEEDFDRNLKRQLEIARVVDTRTSSKPVILRVLSLQF